VSIVPRKSLAEMEQGDQRMQQAVGEEGWRRIRELADAGGFTLDDTLFALEPTYSNVPEEMTVANPSFWHVRHPPRNKAGSHHAATPDDNLIKYAQVAMS
jgi:hypothetical protein